MIKNIIFDFDGVLADTFPFAVNAAMEINKELKLLSDEKINPEEFRSLDMEDFVKEFKISKVKLLFFVLKYRKKLQKEIEGLPTFNDLPHVLHQLRSKKVKLGIVTSNQKKIVQKFLNFNNLEVFDFIFSTFSLFHKEKALLNSLRRFNLKKEETIYVGDETRDIRAAKAAGLKVASVTWGYNFESKLAEYKPDFIINRPQELLDLLQ
ncbi:MAG: HAD-IA family hydrolase [Patescibacteria group bacterium]|nr:HAD-IA family hydrolase [Patescibacteria group bacterium]MBU1952910.1 HAD-IA family hydrolase [Patescibacteria group bacterium]